MYNFKTTKEDFEKNYKPSLKFIGSTCEGYFVYEFGRVQLDIIYFPILDHENRDTGETGVKIKNRDKNRQSLCLNLSR